MNDLHRATQVAQALADPLRLAVLQRLMAGPASVAELVALTGQGQSKVSNHLAVLRDQQLVRSERRGRQRIYRLPNPAVAQLIESLAAIAGTATRRPDASAPIAIARTCYDHLAGTLGVALFDGLVRSGAILPPEETRADVALGPVAREVLSGLGVDAGAIRPGRRRFAYACLDWTERRFHLGGALGAAVCDRFLAAGWIERDQASRTVFLTPEGRRTIKRRFDIEVADRAAAT
ncbi:MAG TPA: metalloregulator ArsR/SmtB family transcription factor [Dehalococcoidia bacterium]|nr:metalloregulator ArsR/SmtB family transcription factor [Dehalococcoidia bacterium]